MVPFEHASYFFLQEKDVKFKLSLHVLHISVDDGSFFMVINDPLLMTLKYLDLFMFIIELVLKIAIFLQSVTCNLSLGCEIFWAGQHRKSGIGYAARYITDKMVL